MGARDSLASPVCGGAVGPRGTAKAILAARTRGQPGPVLPWEGHRESSVSRREKKPQVASRKHQLVEQLGLRWNARESRRLRLAKPRKTRWEWKEGLQR